jgi:hypothetical protein
VFAFTHVVPNGSSILLYHHFSNLASLSAYSTTLVNCHIVLYERESKWREQQVAVAA